MARAARPQWRALTAVTAVVLALSCSSGGDDDASPTSTNASAPSHASGPSAACGAQPVAASGVTDETLESGGLERRYRLDIPESYDGARPLPVILGLHPLNISNTMVSFVSGFPEMAATNDFIVVAPSGRLNGVTPFWDALPVDDNADVQFIDALLDHLEATLCVDTGRVFAVGMSNGAQMSALLACQLPERIASIGAVAGVEFPEPCDGPAVPVLAFHGTEDPIIPYAGGGLNARTIAEQNLYHDALPPGVPEPLGQDQSMARWAAHNGCGKPAVEERVSAEVRRRTWPSCDAETVLYIVEGGGHSWPGKSFPEFETMFGHTTTDIDATSLLTEFFFGGDEQG